jgi:hypothetical protein
VKTCGGSRRTAPPFFTSTQIHAPVVLPPGNEHRYPFYRRLGGPQTRSGRCGEERNLLSPCENRTLIPWSSSPSPSRWTDWAIMSPEIRKCRLLQKYQDRCYYMLNELQYSFVHNASDEAGRVHERSKHTTAGTTSARVASAQTWRTVRSGTAPARTVAWTKQPIRAFGWRDWGKHRKSSCGKDLRRQSLYSCH